MSAEQVGKPLVHAPALLIPGPLLLAQYYVWVTLSFPPASDSPSGAVASLDPHLHFQVPLCWHPPQANSPGCFST